MPRVKLLDYGKVLWQCAKNIIHAAWAWLSYLALGMPARGLYLIGITGTDGKTTTTHLLAEVLANVWGRKRVGLLSTTSFWLGEQQEENETKLTTLPSFLVWQLLRRMRKRGVKYVVIEVSSHALAQHRLLPLCWDGAIWLNLAREHLDYHRTMANYARAKSRLWRRVRRGGWLVGNMDDVWVRYYCQQLSRARQCTFTLKKVPASVRGKILQGVPKLVLEAAINDTRLKISTRLCGSGHAENVLATLAAGKCMRLPLAQMQAAIAGFRGVPGRWEVIALPRAPFTVVIDYAVTPHAFHALYRTAHAWQKKHGREGRIIHVFGAAGERDRGKRPLLGAIAARHADLIVLTDEDPFGENPDGIVRDIARGIRKARGQSVRWCIIRSRRRAIFWALKQARPGDLVLLTGKGAETCMVYGRQRIPWREGEEVRKAWRLLRKERA